MLDRPAGATRPANTVRHDGARATADAEAAAPSGTDILAILWRRKRLLLASMLLCPVLTFVAISQLTPLYTATGTLLYDSSEYKPRELQSILRVDPITDAVMNSQVEVIRGLPVIEQVMGRLNLLTSPEFNASLRPASWTQRVYLKLRRMLFGSVPTSARAPPGPPSIRCATPH